MMNKRVIITAGLPVLVLALLVNFGLGLKLGMSKPMTSDAQQYLSIATNLAAGKGYVSSETFWPGKPTMQRLPGWPFAVSLALRVFPHSSPDVVMRCLDLVLNAIAAFLAFILTLQLFGRVWPAVIAGMIYTFHPTGLYLAYEGGSETLFVVIAAVALSFVSRGTSDVDRTKVFSVQCSAPVFLAALLFGLACLVRTNFILWIVFLPMLLLVGPHLACGRSRNLSTVFGATRGGALHVLPGHQSSGTLFSFRPHALYLTLCILLSTAPATLWAYRNHGVSGHFPVLSTLRGQTFYGGNNPVVAHDFKYWGYWVFPDQIPGETPLALLSKTMSEYEVDQYYYKKGKDFIFQNPASMPKLLLGKLVRAYVPIPWTWSLGTGAVAIFRLFLYGLILVGMWRHWHDTSQTVRMCLVAMILASIAQILIFWGCARFAFPLECLFIPFAAVALRGGRMIR